MSESPDFDFLLGPDGPLAHALGEYEYRPPQVEMARRVWQAIVQKRDALIEAGTGTGKSIAYLVPALLSEQPLIVSTANKALQRQLFEKDVPLVRRALELDFDTVLIKGRQNYLCLRKYQLELPQQRAFAQLDPRHARNLKALEDWARSTERGDLEELPFVLDPDTLARVTCPADECLYRDCFFYDRCFVMLVRQRAADARVVITNHHLLISDLALRGMGGVILPDVEVVVCDEAHRIEEVATSIFETTVTDYTVPALLQRRLVREHATVGQLEELSELNRLFFERVLAAMDEPTVAIEGEWQEGVRLGHKVRELAESLARLNPYADDPDMEEENAYFGLAVQAVRSAGDDLLAVSKSDRDGEVVRYAEQVRRRHVNLVLHATPISAAGPLGEHLFGQHTVVCTSATLAAGGRFDLFVSRCGVPDRPIELIGAPVFDYPNQALIYLPRLPAYDWENREVYFEAVAQETSRLLEVSRGRAFCLFTSWAGLRYVAERLRDSLPWPVLVQGELPRPELLRAFKSTPHSVLFGVRSFWEGVDVPGEALSLVIIDKLPFPSPRDPLHRARVERIAGEGGNPFMEYTLPLMILTLKQGFGRLIRTRADRGVVALLDNRLTGRRYGSMVLRSLPPARVTSQFGEVYRFFARGGFDAEYALSVWVDGGGELVQYRWRLARLLDGRIREGMGVAADVDAARWAGVRMGSGELREAIRRGGRREKDFGLEIRLPRLEDDGDGLPTGLPPDVRSALGGFGRVRVVWLERRL